MNKPNQIKIKNTSAHTTTIDIEGEIGVPEEWQFDEPESRVATYRKFKDMVGSISRIQTPEVVVNIRSTGGDVGDAMLIYDALCSLDATITTRCAGYVASAATLIAQAASEGRRQITSESLYLVHRSVASVEGDVESLTHSAELLAKTDRRIAEIYAERSGRDVAQFEALMAENDGAGRWLTPDEAVEMGLVDVVVTAQRRKPSVVGRIAEFARKLVGHGGESAEQLPDTSEVRSFIRAPKTQPHTTPLFERQRLYAPTVLRPREDPEVCDVKRSFNEAAYARDAENFKNQ